MDVTYFEIDTIEMTAVELIAFLEFLNFNKMKYASYHGFSGEKDTTYLSGDEIVIEITGDMDEDFNKELSTYMYYQPIIQLDEEPEVSDIDLIEEMTNID